MSHTALLTDLLFDQLSKIKKSNTELRFVAPLLILSTAHRIFSLIADRACAAVIIILCHCRHRSTLYPPSLIDWPFFSSANSRPVFPSNFDDVSHVNNLSHVLLALSNTGSWDRVARTRPGASPSPSTSPSTSSPPCHRQYPSSWHRGHLVFDCFTSSSFVCYCYDLGQFPPCSSTVPIINNRLQILCPLPSL